MAEQIWPIRYRCEDNIDYSWVDMMHARPRTRARLSDGVLAAQDVFIDEAGVITCDLTKVTLDTYQGEGYEDVRAEGEAYWAQRDEQKENEA